MAENAIFILNQYLEVERCSKLVHLVTIYYLGLHAGLKSNITVQQVAKMSNVKQNLPIFNYFSDKIFRNSEIKLLKGKKIFKKIYTGKLSGQLMHFWALACRMGRLFVHLSGRQSVCPSPYSACLGSLQAQLGGPQAWLGGAQACLAKNQVWLTENQGQLTHLQSWLTGFQCNSLAEQAIHICLVRKSLHFSQAKIL